VQHIEATRQAPKVREYEEEGKFLHLGNLSKQLGVKPKIIEIVESRTKWGSCSSNKKVTFNYRLAMAPIEVIDYVKGTRSVAFRFRSIDDTLNRIISNGKLF
jgi:hypothetical protein